MNAPFGLSQWGAIAALTDCGLRAESADLNALRDPAAVLRQSRALLADARLTVDARAAVSCLVVMVEPHAVAA